MALGKLSLASAEATDTAFSSSHRHGSTPNQATSTSAHIPSPLSCNVVNAQQSLAATQLLRRQENEDEDEESEEKEEVLYEEEKEEETEEVEVEQVDKLEQAEENLSQVPARKPQYSNDKTAVNRKYRVVRLREGRAKQKIPITAIDPFQTRTPRALDESQSRHVWSGSREDDEPVVGPSRPPERRRNGPVAQDESNDDGEIEKNAYATLFARPTYAYDDAKKDGNDDSYTSYDPSQPYFTPKGSLYPEHTYSDAISLTAPQDVGEDGLEEYDSDTEEVSRDAGSVDVPFKAGGPPGISSDIPTASMVIEEQTLEDNSHPQLFLKKVFADVMKDDSHYMDFVHSDPLTDLHFSYGTPSYFLSQPASSSSSSVPRSVSAFTSAASSKTSGLARTRINTSSTIYSNTDPRSNPNTTTSQGGVYRRVHNIRLHYSIAPYQRHRPNYAPDPFTLSCIPAAIVSSSVNGDIPQVDWPTYMPTPSVVNLTGSDDDARDKEMTVLDQAVERYYWDERAAAVWARDEGQREAIRQGTASIEFMQVLNTFAASHPPNFITRRLKEMDDILTPQIFQSSPPSLDAIYQPRLNTYLAQVAAPTLDKEATYHAVTQRYRDIYKGYRIFAARYHLPFCNTILDFDADVNMLGPNDLERLH